MKYECALIQDLIPLYIDNCLSEASTKAVEDHMRECLYCNAFLKDLKENVEIERKGQIEYQEKTLSYAKRVKRIRWVIGTSIIAAFLIVCGVFFTILEGSYDYFAVDLGNYVEAKDYIEKGWIPEELPLDASSIRVIYNLDTNNVNGKFHTSEDEANKLKKIYSSATVQDLMASDEALDKTFNDVKSTLEKLTEGVSYYKDEQFVYVFVVDGTVYFFGRN